MNVTPEFQIDPSQEVETFDVLIVGAGISGIDAARHLKLLHPEKRFQIIEKMDGIGGTWRTHRFPGIRSDSDFFTFGYEWKPWLGDTLASAANINDYLEEAVEEQGLRPHTRFGTALIGADWSEADKRWTAIVEDVETGKRRAIRCGFLWMCQGYYDHEAGYMPDYPGRTSFNGPVLHPQHWPEDFDAKGKRIAVIGSGATAATLVPALAEEAKHITIVQRSPTYYAPRPKEHELSELLRPLDLPPEWFHEIMRRRMLLDGDEMRKRAREAPDELRDELLGAAKEMLGDACDLDPHFTPTYRVWRQRLAAIPEGDLFAAIRRGDVSMATDEIERFTSGGIALKSGGHVDADVIVSATGISLQMMGGAAISVNGEVHDFSKSWTYFGMLFTGVPNLAWTFGYIRASWTLRADIVSTFICRLLAHMDESGVAVAEAALRPEEAGMPALPFFDPEDFNPGYITRALPDLPRRGDRAPWNFTQSYEVERDAIPAADLDDGTIRYR